MSRKRKNHQDALSPSISSDGSDGQMVPHRVALYVRVSQARQYEEGMSIEDQTTRLTSYCQSKGWEIAAIYEEHHTAKTLKRPALLRLLLDAERNPKPFDRVLAAHGDRLTRVAEHMGMLRAALAKYSIRVGAMGQSDDPSPHEKMTQTVIAAAAEFENSLRAERVQNVMETNAKNGYWNGGRPTFGYCTIEVPVPSKSYTKKTLEILPREAEIVSTIYRLRRDGVDDRGPLGVSRIASFLSDNKVPWRSGKCWTVQCVYDILRDSTYIGLHPYHLFHLDGAAEKNTNLREVAYMPCPSIIDKDLFDDVQVILDSANPSVTPARSTKGALMLTDLLFCHCGAAMHIATGKSGRYKYYKCGNRHRTANQGCSAPMLSLPIVEAAVGDAILDLLVDRMPALASGIQMALKGARKPYESDLHSKQPALTAHKRRMKDIIERILGAKGTIRTLLEEQLKEDQANHDRLEKEIAVLRGYLRQPIPSVKPATYLALLELIRRGMGEGPLVLKRDIAHLLISRIDFDGSDLHLTPAEFNWDQSFLAQAA